MIVDWLLLADDELQVRLEQRGERDVNARALVAGRDKPTIADHITRILEGEATR